MTSLVRMLMAIEAITFFVGADQRRFESQLPLDGTVSGRVDDRGRLTVTARGAYGLERTG
jgi:hypothetical protein